MLDDLLGRSDLKDRIEDLEADLRHTERELEAERERRADAQTARQEAERRVNRLEDRIDQLEGELERRDADDETIALAPKRVEDLSGARLTAVLDRLEGFATGPEGLLSAHVRDGRDLPGAVREAFGDRAGLVASATPCFAVIDDAGILGACLSVPVPPEPFVNWAETAQFERAWFEPSGTYTLALVRSDLFAMGTYDGEERAAFHGFTGDLKSQHSKGGFSQSRFERLRDEQIDDHVERCLAALAERDADPLYVVGERSVLGEFSTVADVTEPVDATGEPEAALADAFRSFWTVQLRAV